jgi:hypothetical protein
MNESAVMESLHRGKVLAAAIPASCQDSLAWIGIYPLDLSRQTTLEFLRNHGLTVLPSAASAYHIRTFEVRRELIEADASIAEQEMTNKNSYFAFGDDDLRTRMRALHLAIESLDLPFKSGYPI